MLRLLYGFLVLLTLQARAGDDGVPRECVVLLHGLGRTELSMVDLAWELRRAGYTVANVTYPSLARPIEELAQLAVEEGLAECRQQGAGVIHFATHSLGGILVRQYLAGAAADKLTRVVMLGPPNQGSKMADIFYAIEWLRPLYPHALGQLGTGPESIPQRLGPVDFELGVIAGTSDWLSPLPGGTEEPGDGTVSVAETRVEGMVDFIQLPASHTFMMWSPEVQAQVIHFLRHGYFAHPDTP
ncbi:alpha/beta fold hydrolase [Parahaliea mediterranea]|uniref:Alpha/beta hydrolase n=1 Tax=Parahaliea mediterranea TaxID=651086 RepID=A0A939DGB1_9GAMM|nr:alpha/beta fold hydrolase [Parahaliea mediterranea]MBN7797738.1 alpha/beta hydrolase [Parahaliea mediterranea]